jgi:hypothetical protein
MSSLEIMRRKNSIAYSIVGQALADNKFTIPDDCHRWDMRMAAEAVHFCVQRYSTLYMEAGYIKSTALKDVWRPKQVRAVLGSFRTEWIKQRAGQEVP